MTVTDRGRVRPLVEDDLPQILDLHQRVFGGGAGRGREASRSHLEQILYRHPWHDEALPSLVYQEGAGRIVGCLGVMPRPMVMKGRPLRAAISHNFMVEPECRNTLAGVHLLKTFFAGHQDLSIADGVNLSWKLGEAFGAVISLLHSLRWTRPLRPGGYALSSLTRRGLRAPFRPAARLLARGADLLAANLRHNPFRLSVPRVWGEELTAETLLPHLTELSGGALLPEYDGRSLAWLLALLRGKTHLGTLRTTLVRNARHDVIGWYLYYEKAGGVGEVVQLVARPDSTTDVLDHCFFNAWKGGVVALSGQTDPALLQALSDRNCLLRLDAQGPRRFVHSKHPDVREAILRGDAFLTRLESEWSIW